LVNCNPVSRIKKPRVALKYLKTALKIEKKNPEVQAHDLASTYLNLCAIYSELGFHSEAINKATKSILLLKSHLSNVINQSKQSLSPKNTNELDDVIRKSNSNASLKFLFAKKMEPQLI
jgi:tetratricopeptide (TPR) repeat protein